MNHDDAVKLLTSARRVLDEAITRLTPHTVANHLGPFDGAGTTADGTAYFELEISGGYTIVVRTPQYESPDASVTIDGPLAR